MLGHLADVGSLFEVLKMLGVGVPSVHNLPVIGPLLSAFLKIRAARAMLGRLGGQIPATLEATAAGKAAAIRDNAAQAVDRMLGLAEKGVRTVRPAAGRMAALGAKLYDDGQERPEPKTDAEAVVQRIDELASAATNPDGVRRAVRKQLRGAVDPDLVAAIEDITITQLGYLHDNAPKRPLPSLLGRNEWRPSVPEIDRFARRVRAARDPMSVLDSLAHGAVTPEEAETLRTVYPHIYGEAQQRLMMRSGEVAKSLPYQRVLKLGILFEAPLLPSLRPERIAALQPSPSPQASGAPAGSAPPAPGGPPPNLDNLYMSPGDRRALGR